MNILKRRERITTTHHSQCYYWKDMPDAGFGFDCDKDGNVDFDAMEEPARLNYEKCRDGTFAVTGPFLESYKSTYFEPAELKCSCGCVVYLTMSLVNDCECGAQYNSSGQRLAPQSQWGDDTGESISEIMQGNLRMDGEW